MEFSYTAISESGETISGVIEAGSKSDAEQKISVMGHLPVDVKKSPGGKNSLNFTDIMDALTPVKPGDLVLFTKQFRTLLRAGVNILNIMDILEKQTENKKMLNVIKDIRRDLNEGILLNVAFSRHPGVFSSLYCSMIEAGELSGALPDILDRLIFITEHENKIKADIKSALRYPMIVVITLIAAFFILLIFVIPQFEKIFNKAGIILPLPTKICIGLYSLLSSYWFFFVVGALTVIVGLVLSLRTRKGQFIKDTIILSIPIIGPLFIKSIMSRFASVFSILLSSGVAIMGAMEVLSKTLDNEAITRQFEVISEKLGEGQGIAKPLESAKYFPPMVVNMIAIGEESGSMDEMLKEVADHYDDEVEYAVKGLSEAIGPILTIGLAVVVGFFALAIFLPMWDLTKMVK